MPLPEEISPEIAPGDDFYAHVNAKWIAANPLPDDKARVGAFTVLGDENTERLRALLESGPEADEPVGVRRLRQFYRGAMDEAAIEAAGLTPVRANLERIASITDARDVLAFISTQHAAGRSLLWHLFIEPDDKDSRRYIARLAQFGLGLPDRDYYLDSSDQFATIREAYKNYLTKLFELMGSSRADDSARNVIELETKLARASMTATERRDVDAMYNPYAVGDLAQAFPGMDWVAYLNGLGLGHIDELFVSQPKFLAAAITLVTNHEPAAWKSYLTAHFLGDLLPKLPQAYADLSFDFYGRILAGTQAQEPRWRRIIKTSANLLPEPLGQLFVARHFDEDAKTTIADLVARVQAALGRRIDGFDWMSDATKRQAHAKLATFLPLLGYPDTWRDYSELSLPDGYLAGYLAIYAHEWQRDTARLGTPVDRREWLMSPATVNAYYWSNTNGITFPAGILQPPFFDGSGDFATNYGGIGVVIGHEITHGFDDKGSKFDANGNLNSWWTAEDRAAFEARAGGLRDQFASYLVGDRHVNGELTLGENIADLGGLLVAFDAMQSYLSEHPKARAELDGFSPEQRFFMSYARVWRGNLRPELALEFLVRDPHAPGQFRTNGGVVNVDAWYEAFNVARDDALYRPPSDRVRIW